MKICKVGQLAAAAIEKYFTKLQIGVVVVGDGVAARDKPPCDFIRKMLNISYVPMYIGRYMWNI